MFCAECLFHCVSRPQKGVSTQDRHFAFGPRCGPVTMSRNGKYHPGAFGSHTLLPAEMRYHSTKLEFLAMKWGITHFSLYLMGKKFRVRMDKNPLIYFAMSPNLDTMKHQWIGELAPYNFSVEYQKEKPNVMADMLNRMTSRLNEKGD